MAEEGENMNWHAANEFIMRLNEKNYCGYSDWRLPTDKELESLVDRTRFGPALPFGHPFSNVQSYCYWSSTAYADSTGHVWAVSMCCGDIDSNCKSDGTLYVWPVRTTALPPYITPHNRFADNLDGTVTDNKTGLMWTKDANIRP